MQETLEYRERLRQKWTGPHFSIGGRNAMSRHDSGSKDLKEFPDKNTRTHFCVARSWRATASDSPGTIEITGGKDARPQEHADYFLLILTVP